MQFPFSVHGLIAILIMSESSDTGRKTISLRNVTNDSWEKLEFRDRIIQVGDDVAHFVSRCDTHFQSMSSARTYKMTVYICLITKLRLQ